MDNIINLELDGDAEFVGEGGFSKIYSRKFNFEIERSPLESDQHPERSVTTKDLTWKVSRASEKNENERVPPVSQHSKPIMKSNTEDKRLKQEQAQEAAREHNERKVLEKLKNCDSKYILKHFLANKNGEEKEQSSHDRRPALNNTGDSSMIYQEYCCYSDLRNYLDCPAPKSLSSKINLALGILEGLENLHKKAKLVHKDLKPHNIFLSNGLTPKIGDFGESFIMDEDNFYVPTGATAYYDSPELKEASERINLKNAKTEDERQEALVKWCKMFKENCNEAVDVYAYGLLLADIFFGIKPSTISFQKEMPKTEQRDKLLLELGRALELSYNTIGIHAYQHIADIIKNCMENASDRWLTSNIKQRLEFILARHVTTYLQMDFTKPAAAAPPVLQPHRWVFNNSLLPNSLLPVASGGHKMR